MNKVLSLFAALLLGCLPVAAQDVPLAVYAVRNPNGLSPDQVSAVHSKIVSLVANTGYASTDGGAAVGVQPEIIVYAPRTVSAGIRNLTTLDAELVLNVQQRDGQTVFGSKRKKFSASGKDEQQARSQLVAALPSSDAGLLAFLTEVKPKVQEYYSKNCATVMAEAERMATVANFQKALSTLLNIPAGTPCRAEADVKLQKVYNQYRDNICRKNLLAAQGAAAAKKYAESAAYLRNIDPQSACYQDAQNFVGQLRSQADADFTKTLDALTEYWKAESSLDNRRFEIVRSFLKDSF